MSISPGAVPTMTAIFAQCPPLPNISNPALLDRVFTHRSLTAQPANVFEDLPSSPSQHNEALEHLGDSVLNLYSTLLIQHLYPLLHVGPSSRIRSMVVANTHLARFTQYYQLHFQLRGNAAQQLNIQASLPIHADLFEAYLGALYMDQGPEVAKSWLWAVLTPSIHLAYEIVRHVYHPNMPPSAQATTVFQPEAAVAGVPPPMLSPPLPVSDTAGCTSLLNQYYAQRHQYLDWEFDPPGGSISAPIWTAKAIVREEGELARATSNTKKAAKNVAAKTALVKLGLLQDGTGASTPHTGPGAA